jgi:hypothetical protein
MGRTSLRRLRSGQYIFVVVPAYEAGWRSVQSVTTTVVELRSCLNCDDEAMCIGEVMLSDSECIITLGVGMRSGE